MRWRRGGGRGGRRGGREHFWRGGDGGLGVPCIDLWMQSFSRMLKVAVAFFFVFFIKKRIDSYSIVIIRNNFHRRMTVTVTVLEMGNDRFILYYYQLYRMLCKVTIVVFDPSSLGTEGAPFSM